MAIGGLALGAALAYPYYAYGGYPYYPYSYPYPAYGPTAGYPTVVEEAPVVYEAAPVAAAAAAPIQREVVYPNGKYVLYGDGVTQAWQWVWVPAAPAPPPPPPQR